MRWSDAARPPTDRQLREFAITGALLLAAGATWRALVPGNVTLAACLAALAIILLLLGVGQPRWLAPVFRAWMIAAFPVAWLVSQLLLAMIYYGVITPLGLAFRIVGRDVFGRPWQQQSTSYWRDKPAAKRSDQYLRQF